MPCCSIWEKFDESGTLLKEYLHWKLVLRKNHATLGSCVAISKRHLESFSQISDDEMKEFGQIMREVEKAVCDAFHPDLFNYMALMFKDHHTHFHIFPRYQKPVSFAGIEWVDSFKPEDVIGKQAEISLEVAEKIKRELRRRL